MRRGEVLELTWSDVDLVDGQLRVRRTLQRIRQELIFGTPKTARSIRTVSLPKRCVHALLARQPSGLIFTTSTGRAIDPRSMNRMLTILCGNAKVRWVRVHDCATHAAHCCLHRSSTLTRSWRRSGTARSR
ncbi:hypothetical protein [Streptomyces sp. NBC_01367]|uniref:hypothetical protein n=1 Tax=Streptomyces sp. NBC_01367 TaxID=2903841 RepID=UPI00324E9600